MKGAMPDFSLLNAHDPDPVRSLRKSSLESPFVLVGDHAGNAIPEALGDLGLSAADRERHIALDLGVEAMGRQLSETLKAPFIWQAYSRLVADGNRHPEDAEWAQTESDGSAVPGNRGLSEQERASRRTAIFDPYHDAIGEVLDRRQAMGVETILISLHSFTPEMGDGPRPWEIGILHDGHRDDFARSMLKALEGHGRVIGDNQPYHMDATDYTVPRHAFSRGLRYAEIEVRQDILANEREAITALIADILRHASNEKRG